MNSAVLVMMLVVAASALPHDVYRAVPEEVLAVLKRTEVRDLSGQFDLDYTTANGIRMTESGRLSNGAVIVKEGTVSYTSPEGIPVTLSWIADEGGYRAVGSHIPVEPVVA